MIDNQDDNDDSNNENDGDHDDSDNDITCPSSSHVQQQHEPGQQPAGRHCLIEQHV